jgi:hypothetical protein
MTGGICPFLEVILQPELDLSSSKDRSRRGVVLRADEIESRSERVWVIKGIEKSVRNVSD